MTWWEHKQDIEKRAKEQDFMELYKKVHDLNNKINNTWLETWEDEGVHWIRFNGDEEFCSSDIKEVYLEAYEYLVEQQEEIEREEMEFQKGWDSYEPTPLSLKGVTLKKVAV